MNYINRPDKLDPKYGQNSFIHRDVYIKDIDEYCNFLEEKLFETQKSLDILLAKIEGANKNVR